MIQPAEKAPPVRDENLRLIFAAQEQAFLAKVRADQLAGVPGDQRQRLAEILALDPEQRSEQQAELLAAAPGVAVTGATLAEFDPEGAALVAESSCCPCPDLSPPPLARSCCCTESRSRPINTATSTISRSDLRAALGIASAPSIEPT